MEEVAAVRYWCHMCSRTVNPIDVEIEIKCPHCDNGFVEEMGGSGWEDRREPELGSDRTLSLWAPILLGMMGHPRRQRRLRRLEFDSYDDEDDDEVEESFREGRTELYRDMESLSQRRRRRRNSATVLQLLEDIRAAGMGSESGDRGRERGHLIMIDPVNQALIIRDAGHFSRQNSTMIGSLGDYFVEPGLDLLLQHLAESDPSRYGTPPARKEEVEAMPTVTIKEKLQCSICLDDFQIGAEAREMPCDHKFHSGCILPWLELHSSCPVCRYQLPADESKLNTEGSSNANSRIERERREREMEMEMERERERGRARAREREREREREKDTEDGHGSSEKGDGEGRNGNGRRFSISWPFHGFFSSSSSNSGGGNTSSSSSSTGRTHEGASQPDEN
ncbi:hypothetical protein SAY87_001769 [Trapa incisa]|uniref:RING-type E3 ubiquitin transferase n=1 Tax=Trapa incisa TaxID=236973 RepID=A0AAN7PY32_9MYRT|nr:hypothetical protein SAY87_001769 [Trapa incisa]